MTSVRTEQKQETRRRIFDTALELFRTQGVAKTSVDQIVRIARVSKGTFFVHFSTKNAIFGAYVDLLTESLMPLLPQWLTLPPLLGIYHAFDALTENAERDRILVPDVIYAELFGDPWDDGKPTALQQLFLPLVQQAQSCSVIRTDLDPVQVIEHLLSAYLIALAWAVRRGERLNTALNLPIQLALDGLRPRPGSTPQEENQ